MDPSAYRKRTADDYFAKKLRSAGAILIEGPKWCGKTTTAEMMSKSALYCQDPDETDWIVNQAETKPSELLKGKLPRLIDEWQTVPKIWNAVRFAIDKSRATGQYILTGSVVPDIDNVKSHLNSGTGRISPVFMRTMSLFESGESCGSVSLKDLFDGKSEIGCRSDMTLEKLAHVSCRGGWPSALDMDDNDSLNVANDYCEMIAREDCRKVDGVKRDYLVMKSVMRSLGRLTCTKAEISVIRKDINEIVTERTLWGYIDALKKLYVEEDIPAWHPAILSKTRVRSSPKRCFADPSIATASIGMGPGALMKDAKAFGQIFESLCVRDLRVYSQLLDGTVYHYSDSNGLEVDSVIELRDGRWGATEIKLNQIPEDQAAANLIRLKKKVENEPEFLAIITGTGFAHVRDDGVAVVPIGCLGP